MKRSLLSLLALLLALSMLLCCFVSCKEDPPQTDDPNAGDDTTPPAEDAKPYTHSETYYTETQHNTIKAALEAKDSAFGALDGTLTPAVTMNIETLTDCSITSISIPVQKTLAADSRGRFTFTVSVVDSTLTGMRSAPVSGITLELGAEEYELTEKSFIYRYVTVDLSSSPIVLKAGETLALGSAEDTLIAAYVKTAASDIATYLKKECGEPGMFQHGASAELIYDRDLLCFDFTMQRTYASEAAYNAYVAAKQAEEDAFNAKVQALKDAGYKGKKVSIVGDSISTFSGVSNNTSINTTLGQNSSHNSASGNVCDWTLTYWGRLITELEMELCVPNCWSGSKVYGTKENGVVDPADSLLERADQLHRDGGTPNDPTDDVAPDVIIIYMGINDTNNSPKGTFLNAPGIDKAAAMQQWKAEELDAQFAKYKETKTITVGGKDGTYENWQEAYALGIMLMQETYPDAEIWLMTLVESNAHSSGTKDKIDHANLYIRAIADMLDVKLIDQQENGYITKQNSYLYGHDEHELITAIHPNLKGHALMARLIIDEFYKNLP